MRRVAIACAAVAFALSASPAVAKSAKKKRGLGPVVTRVAVSAPATDGGQALSATARCPKGRRAVGGGFDLPRTASATVILHESLRAGARGWTTTGVSAGATSVGLTVQSIVYCRRVAGKIIDVAATAQMGAAVNAPATATASCPRKRPSLLSGGFTSSVGAGGGGEIAIPTASYRGGRSWSFSGLNNSATARTVTSHAYCAKGLKSRPVLLGSTSEQNVMYGEGITATTAGACPGRRRLSAGGFIGSLPSAAFGLISDSRLSGTSWQAESFNLGPAGALSVASQGICL